ncbi:hypothetical protein NXW76_06235 [Bacteroides thetaiotaomicron]|nr:hypothetical protein [Bacteroides thetaiotaomicron]
MEEKEKRTSKEEEGSGYGLTADSDHCELTTDDRTPFSENAETRRLQNAFGEALGDLPLPDEVREEWTTFLQRQAQQKRKLYLRICLSGGVARPLPCYCYFGPLGTSQARTASSRTSKSSPPSMHRNKLPLSKRTAESSYLPRPPRPPASHWRTEVTSF